MTTPAPLLTLNDGRSMPALGYGTYPITGDEGVAVFGRAIEDGYRMLDSAASYGNETEVGAAVRESSVPRSELFVTTKLRGESHGRDETLKAFEGSLTRLGLDYVDLYLIHWPLPRLDRYVDTWRAFVELREEGLVRSVGVSNFMPEHVDRLVDETGVVPAVNQVEMHPYFPQPAQRAYDAGRGIVTQAWSPLGRKSDLLGNETLDDVAYEVGVTPGQAVLRWHVQHGSVPLPKSEDPTRMAQNLDVFSFSLSEEQMGRLDGIATGERVGGHPLEHEEF
ncbi:MAG: aldo/keto reductase [Nocardioidaceae bacterium]|nr:aldo/keto reductase [Nocardioidaceae bacterium]